MLWRLGFLLLLWSGIFALSPGATVYGLEDAIIAIVNEDIITLKDLKDYTHSLYTQLRLEGRSDFEIQRIMADLERNGIGRLIEDKLVLSEANRMGMEVNSQLVQQRLDDIRSAYPDEQSFLSALLAQGATITDLKKKLQNNMKIKFLIDREIKSKVYVNPREITDYYKDHFEEYQKPERLKVKSIFLSRKRYGELLEEKCAEVLDVLSAGEDFDAVAENYSEGNAIKMLARGQLKAEIESSLFELQPGEVSEPIAIPGGQYIFFVEDRIPEEISSLDDVRESIRSLIFQQKFRTEYQDWIDQLKEQAFIDIKG